MMVVVYAWYLCVSMCSHAGGVVVWYTSVWCYHWGGVMLFFICVLVHVFLIMMSYLMSKHLGCWCMRGMFFWPWCHTKHLGLWEIYFFSICGSLFLPVCSLYENLFFSDAYFMGVYFSLGVSIVRIYVSLVRWFMRQVVYFFPCYMPLILLLWSPVRYFHLKISLEVALTMFYFLLKLCACVELKEGMFLSLLPLYGDLILF
jgi:hypothetical protein